MIMGLPGLIISRFAMASSTFEDESRARESLDIALVHVLDLLTDVGNVVSLGKFFPRSTIHHS